MSGIDKLRGGMDDVTLEMIRLLKKRTDIAREIGRVKKSTGREVTDGQREESLRRKVLSLCGELGFDGSAATRLLNFLINESIRVQSGKRRTHLSVFLEAKRLEEAGKKIIHMEVGEPDFMPPLQAKEALGRVYDEGFVRYGQARGLPQFRSLLAEYASRKFNAAVRQENILVSPGARFAVFLAITTLLDPGDEMIIIEPAWPAYRDCALNAGIKVCAIKTSLENGWEPSPDQIRAALNPNTKMIVLNYPNNPTGKILPPKVLDEIMSLASDNGLYVLSDEIYSEYSSGSWKSVLEYGYKMGIVTQSLSKSHAMTGFRIGYAVADGQVIDRMAQLQALCLTSVSEPVQYVAMKSLNSDVSSNSGLIRRRLEMLSARARDMDLEFAAPEGAMYLFARVKKEGFDGAKFANMLLAHGLAVAPGEGFGEYRDFVRISACQDEKKLMEGMDIFNGMLGDNDD